MCSHSSVAMSRIWSIEKDAIAIDLEIVSDGVFTFGRSEAFDSDSQPIACFLREGHTVIAGATGRTEYLRLFINYLWVKETIRRQGVGQEALRRIEIAAAERGCQDALIETLSDNNADFYHGLGYRPVATIPRFVGRFTRHIMVKPLPPIV